MKFGFGVIRNVGAAFWLFAVSVACVSGVTVATAPAMAQSASSIVVQGNRRVEADTIRSYFKPGPSGRIDATSLDDGLKALVATGLFQDVNINQPGGRVVVTVVENPVINRVVFEGNNRAKDEQLTAEVQSKARGTLSRPAVQADVQRIIEVYRRLGRYEVTVTPQIIEQPNNRVDLVFDIKEGVKTGVKVVEFVGNKSYSDRRLSDVIRTRESGILSFFSNADIFDQDRVEADRDLLRRFYLKNGYADVQIVAATAEFDPARRGFHVVFTIDEGEQYRVGAIDVVSNIRSLDAGLLRSRLRISEGAVYNAEAIEKSIEDMTVEASRVGFPFVSVRPQGDRLTDRRLVNILFTADEGSRVYIERINVRGNTRTRDNVIRREFDVAEGDAYNRALVDRAERRLKNLNYFKSVKIVTEPGSTPDRIILNVDLEERSTGDLSLSGGYSTADGFLASVAITERNLLGMGIYSKAAISYGQRARSFEFSVVEPFLLGYRLSGGLDIFARQTFNSQYTSYETRTLGFSTRLGVSLREDLNVQLRYSLLRQEISVPALLRNCNNVSPNSANGLYPTPDRQATTIDPATGVPFATNCLADGEASIAVRSELARGPVITSLVGYTVNYNTLDNNINPTAGVLASISQDFAGVGGDASFIRTNGDFKTYYELMSDLTALVRVQGGHIMGVGKPLRMLDHFQMGPNLVRGFAPSGIGPRDITAGSTMDALGGSLYWGASLELQAPLSFLPKELGLRGAVFADAGSLMNYVGPTTFPATGEAYCATCINNSTVIRSSVGAGIVWDSPFGPLRFDYSWPLTKGPFDRVQQFRFGGGTTF